MPSVIGSVTGGLIQSNANKSALRAQENAANKATDVQERMYNQSRADLEPFRQTGVTSQNQLSYLLGLNPRDETTYANVNKNIGGMGDLTKKFSLADYIADPGAQFALAQGEKGIARKQAASGNRYSGKALKAASTYNQEMGNQFYDTARNRFNQDQDTLYNRLSGIGSTGLSATNTGVAQSQNNASALGNIYGQLGNAQARSRIQQGNIYNDMLAGSMGGGGSQYGNIASLASFFSDERLKENIKPVGEENGHKIYEFNYIGKPEKYIGVMAQDVLKSNPEAVSEKDGFLSVDYNKIGVNFREVE